MDRRIYTELKTHPPPRLRAGGLLVFFWLGAFVMFVAFNFSLPLSGSWALSSLLYLVMWLRFGPQWAPLTKMPRSTVLDMLAVASLPIPLGLVILSGLHLLIGFSAYPIVTLFLGFWGWSIGVAAVGLAEFGAQKVFRALIVAVGLGIGALAFTIYVFFMGGLVFADDSAISALYIILFSGILLGAIWVGGPVGVVSFPLLSPILSLSLYFVGPDMWRLLSEWFLLLYLGLTNVVLWLGHRWLQRHFLRDVPQKESPRWQGMTVLFWVASTLACATYMGFGEFRVRDPGPVAPGIFGTLALLTAIYLIIQRPKAQPNRNASEKQ